MGERMHYRSTRKTMQWGGGYMKKTMWHVTHGEDGRHRTAAPPATALQPFTFWFCSGSNSDPNSELPPLLLPGQAGPMPGLLLPLTALQKPSGVGASGWGPSGWGASSRESRSRHGRGKEKGGKGSGCLLTLIAPPLLSTPQWWWWRREFKMTPH